MTCKDAKFTPLYWLKKRELGHKFSSFEARSFRGGLYSSLKAVHKWDPQKTVDSTHHGGIFNFDFSPDGSLLAAACEGQSILLFDPFNGRLIGEKSKAHTDCVNIVKFLDSRLFATCSDDSTVALWDVRFLKHKLHELKGHTNWVKNIEYDRNTGLLLTSGFDGNIFTWDINRYTDTETKGTKVFTYKLLMRSKLSPDSSKLVVSTQNGYIIVIHDLDLLTLADDLKNFPPYGSPSSFPFQRNQRRNRVELIREWPSGDNASDIASLQIHPQGWCVMSRNVSRDKKSEWTCIHDLQEPIRRRESQEFSVMPHTSCSQSSSTYTPASASTAPTTLVTTSPCTSTSPGASIRTQTPRSIIINRSFSDDSAMGTVSAPSIVINPPTFSVEGRQVSDNSPQTARSGQSALVINSNPSSGSDDFQSSVTIHITTQAGPSTSQGGWRNLLTSSETSPPSSVDSDTHQEWGLNHPSDREIESLLQDELSSESSADDSDGEFVAPEVQRSEDNNSDRPRYQDLVALIVRYDVTRGIIDVNHRVRLGSAYESPAARTTDRLMYYTEEPNVARGFIKELCFSSDGRLICSPFGFGVRLLGFDPLCSELCDVVPSQPVRLYEVANCLSHSNIVVTCKFSPRHCMFVSGCLSGKVMFHQPVL